MKKILTAVMVILITGTSSFAQFGTESPDWDMIYPYLTLTDAARDHMRVVYKKWMENNLQDGWNKYLIALIGDSVTNDGPFLSDMGKGSDGWIGKGIEGCPDPSLDDFYAEFIDRTIGGDSVLGADAIVSGQSNPWIMDLESHYEEKGNKIGAKIDVEGPMLIRNAINNRKPMWATFMFGQNHLSRGQTFDDTREEWDWAIDSLLNANVMPIILTINPRDHEGIEKYVQDIRDYAEEKSLPLIDWYGAAMDAEIGGCDSKDCTRDGVHPIRRGQGAPHHAGDFSYCSIYASECTTNETAPYAILNLMTLEMLVEMETTVLDFVEEHPDEVHGLKGDFSGDFKLNISDVIALLISGHKTPNDPAVDFNRDGKHNVSDAISLLLYIRDQG